MSERTNIVSTDWPSKVISRLRMLKREFTGRYKSFVVSLILLLLLSTAIVVSHHHENTSDDHDCPVCLAYIHQSAAGASAVVFDSTPFVIATTVVASAPAPIDTLFFFSHGTRGPPS